MKPRPVPLLAIAFYLLMTIALVYPGYVPFNRIRPFILGLPFALFWQILWLLGAIALLSGVYLWERAHQGRS